MVKKKSVKKGEVDKGMGGAEVMRLINHYSQQIAEFVDKFGFSNIHLGGEYVRFYSSDQCVALVFGKMPPFIGDADESFKEGELNAINLDYLAKGVDFLKSFLGENEYIYFQQMGNNPIRLVSGRLKDALDDAQTLSEYSLYIAPVQTKESND